MSAHTPGPWERIGWDVRTKRTDSDHRGFVIATTEISPFPEERHADAQLIAAAPEMLAALKGLLELYGSAGTNQARAAFAAIAKAEGKS
jgi:hypothetical protein